VEFGFHLGIERKYGAAAASLGRAQGEVGAASELVARDSVARSDRQADADTDLHQLIDPERPHQRPPQGIGGCERNLRIDACDQEAKFIAAEPAEDRSLRQALQQPLCHFGQHLVSTCISQGIVDLVEAVEIEDCERQGLLALASRHSLVEQSEEVIVVRQPGQQVFEFEPLRMLLALGELEAEPPELPHGERRKSDEPQCDRGGKRQQPVHHRGRRTLRLPAEPADDAPLAIQHGLNVAPAPVRLRLEFEILEPGGAFEDDGGPITRAGFSAAVPAGPEHSLHADSRSPAPSVHPLATIKR
jgi:hypothetical protein